MTFYNFKARKYDSWVDKCNHWKNKWLYEKPISTENNIIMPYDFLHKFFSKAPENKIIITASGSINNIVWHMNNVKKNDKYIISSQGDMGFELPAAFGAAIASKDKAVYPICGEGSFQLNIQELQTISQYKVPIKFLLFNNGGYGAITMTQTGFFNAKFGVDKSSGISFPDTSKVANTYGIKYISVNYGDDIDSLIDTFINYNDGAIICEIFCGIQGRCPRLKAIKNDDGTFSNRPYEDMDPFMSREEFNKEMIVKQV